MTTDNEKIPLDDFGGLKQENHALGNGKISNQQSVVVVLVNIHLFCILERFSNYNRFVVHMTRMSNVNVN